MKSLNAVIRGFEVCENLDCDLCPYNKHEFPKEYLQANCDSEDKDNDALYYLKEYRERQNDLEKEIAYWKKQSKVLLDVVELLKEKK